MSDAATALPKRRMSVDEFLEWEEGREGRYELLNGEVVTMQAERNVHAIVKLSAVVAFRDAISRAGSPCRAWLDGVSVKIDSVTKFEPDAAVSCGLFDPQSVLVEPVIVVEVTSPSTQRLDVTTKLTKYFRAPSIQHYLIVLIDERLVIHHRRHGDGIATAICPSGDIVLDPPGLVLPVAAFFADLPEPTQEKSAQG